MEVYYHSDRAERLQTGTVIELEPYRPEESTLLLFRCCMDDAFLGHLTRLMREGISLHGARYLLMPGHAPNYISLATELAYEAYRWKHEPGTVSRLQSLFAWRNLEDAVRFGKQARQGRIYRVRCSEGEKPLPYDMNGLKLSYDPEEQERYAERYWAGKPASADADYKPCWEYLLRLPVTVLEEVTVNPIEV